MYKWLILIILFLLISPADLQAETVYFLVGGMTPSFNDSYILPLTEPDDIADARCLLDLFCFPKPGLLVVADIDWWDPNDGININRNYTEDGSPSWSWYVTEFIGFAGSTAEILDGTPTMVEDGTYAGGNRIGFWNYTVIQEIGSEIDLWCYVLEPDCVADFRDLEILANQFLEEDCEYPGWCGGADLNVSGSVDFIDFAFFAQKWFLQN